MTLIADLEQLLDLQLSHCQMTTQGLTISAALTTGEWTGIGARLGNHLAEWVLKYDTGSGGVKWALGDWLIYGEMNTGRLYQVERASQISGVSEGVLWDCKRVSGLFLREERVFGATWQMHEDVSRFKLDDAKKLLQKGVDDCWDMVRWKAACRLKKEEYAKKSGGTDMAPEYPSRIRQGVQFSKTGLVKERVLVGFKCPNCEHVTPRDKMKAQKVYKP